ncbi:meiotic nuclear division protein 1 homolog isoform X1 [Pecten maximus]|uniref:meiotic nuclear division protein 1 homolog isoform X1 n=2 Tax=Pecten maximus TaxID=6579 RepID=UPI0014584BA0|nr:meiotic nuclear division protein 1 homolog isoform X1 [Pecten maximus]
MSKKKGLSVDEKRSRMMDFFFEKKDFFTLKELERMCQKEKGITSMSVKDILTSLVDDAMVDTDKIGTSVYFWAFPSKASQNRKRKISDLTSQLEDLESKKLALTTSVSKAKVGKEDNEDRSELLAALAERREEKSRLMSELELYRECDPEVLQEVQNQTTVAREAANRWTDNVFSIKSWIKRKFSFEESVIDKQFDIPEDFDYME